MKSIQALRERRNALAKSAHEYLEANNEKWTADNTAHYDGLLAQIDDVDGQIKRINDANERLAKEALDGQINDAAGRAQRDNGEVGGLFAKWLRGGDNALTAQEWTAIRATMSTGTGSEGGYTVQKDVAKVIAEALKATGGMRAVATVLTTDMGNPIDYPTSDGTSEEGEILGENDPASDQDAAFGVVPLITFKYSSKGVAVPIELLQDSAVDIEAFVRNRLVSRIARVTNKHFTTGTGTNQPKGIVTASAAGKVGASGQTGTVTYDDLVDLQHSVNRAYRERGAAFMMADSSVKVVRKLKDGQGRPIFVPGYEVGAPGGVPDTLLGDRLVINDDVPNMAANAKSIVYGDFKPYIIRDVMAFTLFRMTDSAYAKKGQVGFLMLSRHAGNFTDIGGAVKHYQNAAS